MRLMFRALALILALGALTISAVIGWAIDAAVRRAGALLRATFGRVREICRSTGTSEADRSRPAPLPRTHPPQRAG